MSQIGGFGGMDPKAADKLAEAAKAAAEKRSDKTKGIKKEEEETSKVAQRALEAQRQVKPGHVKEKAAELAEKLGGRPRSDSTDSQKTERMSPTPEEAKPVSEKPVVKKSLAEQKQIAEDLVKELKRAKSGNWVKFLERSLKSGLDEKWAAKNPEAVKELTERLEDFYFHKLEDVALKELLNPHGLTGDSIKGLLTNDASKERIVGMAKEVLEKYKPRSKGDTFVNQTSENFAEKVVMAMKGFSMVTNFLGFDRLADSIKENK